MPVAKADAVAEMNIHALRQISDGLAATNRAMSAFGDDLKDVRERVIRIEERDVKGEIQELRAEHKAIGLRVDALERVKDRQDGALGAGNWLAKYAPWLLAVVAAAMAGLGLKESTG